MNSDFDVKNNITKDTRYRGSAMDYESLALCYTLQGDWGKAKATFIQANQFGQRPFHMAYNEQDPEYGGASVTDGIQESNAIKATEFALAAGDLALAKQAAGLYRVPADNHKMPAPIHRYIFALQAFLDGDKDRAQMLLQISLDEFLKKPSKGQNYKVNYHTLSLALLGVVLHDQPAFNKGLEAQLQFYTKAAKGEIHDTEEEFVCLHALALTNLAIFYGLKQEIHHPLIPQGLVVSLQ
ncbi:hypothetical protein QCD60_10785 [Pokkaliibacter sp. MBI-7]|uniref:hypothetical protein n=1 Tax=Pokkaliibacter sp. MBI-7 TaxID=3040600 RepID=UPI002446C774|nr:hypothetical protein [Pokkaliibacter sp. MBI-7]MDH2433054.1 hypothetical protein [Pokkaliibacter sp. MBI-7]